MVDSELNSAGGKRGKKETRGDKFSLRFLFSLSIFLPALYYLNASNSLLIDYNNIKKMQSLLNWQRLKACFVL